MIDIVARSGALGRLVAAAPLVVLGAGLLGPAPASARPVDCELTINGRAYTDGNCDFEPLDSDGSFMMRGGQGIFVYVNMVRPGVAEASWNETPRSTSAQAPLGEVRRNGGCWQSQNVMICAWDRGQRPPQRQAQMQPPPAPPPLQRGGAGAQSLFIAGVQDVMCIQAGGPIRELTPVILGDCNGPGAAIQLDPRARKIRFAANPRFCIGFTNEGAAQVLQCDGTEQDYAYDPRTQSIRFDGPPPPDCLGTRGEPRIGARIVIERCTNAPDQRYAANDPVPAEAPPPRQVQAPPPPAPQPQQRPPAVTFMTSGFPEVLCITAARAQPLAPIGIGLVQYCSDPLAAFYVDPAARRIRLVANPRLCFGIDAGGEPLASVWPCDEVQVDLGYDPRTQTIRRIGENECIGVRGQWRMGARLQLEDCGRNAADQRYDMVPADIRGGAAPPPPRQVQAPPPPAPPPQQRRAAGAQSLFLVSNTEVMCIQAAGPIRELTPVVLGDCNGPGAAIQLDPRARKIRFAANPRFCIGFTNDGAAQVLQCDGTEQDYAYDPRTQSIRFDGPPPPDCLGTRGPPRLGARIVIERCANAPDQRYAVNDAVQ